MFPNEGLGGANPKPMPDHRGSFFQKRAAGRHLTIGGATIEYLSTSHMTDDAIGIYRVTIAPYASGAGLHYHQRMTEAFEVHAGTLSMILDGKEIEVESGDFVLVRPNSVHAFANRNNMPVVFTLTFIPALAREGFFEGLADLWSANQLTDKKAMLAIMAKYDQIPIEGVEAWSRAHHL